MARSAAMRGLSPSRGVAIAASRVRISAWSDFVVPAGADAGVWPLPGVVAGWSWVRAGRRAAGLRRGLPVFRLVAMFLHY
jgi:hypothetical protein